MQRPGSLSFERDRSERKKLQTASKQFPSSAARRLPALHRRGFANEIWPAEPSAAHGNFSINEGLERPEITRLQNSRTSPRGNWVRLGRETHTPSSWYASKRSAG